MNDDVWVWDTWSLTDENANQISYKGWDVIFSLVADRHAGYGFDQRHWNARIGYFFRKTNADPAKDKWNYGGHLFLDNTSIGNTEWSGSTRLMQGDHVNVFYTATTFYDVAERNAGGGGIAPDAVIAKALGNIHADQNGVSFDGFEHTKLLEPDGVMYQNKAQNPGFAFRDPYTFADPAQPGKTFMVFEGNTGGKRGDYKCKDEDLGYQPGDPPRRIHEHRQHHHRCLVPDRQRGPGRRGQQGPDPVALPAADPVRQLRQRPDRASADLHPE